MSSKSNKEEQVLDKNVESTDPTLDDDNKSDSDDSEYKEIEIEYEEIVSDAEPLRVTISEVETITPKDENEKQQTLILKSDGTTEKLEKEKKKTKAGRMLTSQEESILLPLIQSLLASSGSNETSEKSKHENTPFPEKEQTTSSKNNETYDTCEKMAMETDAKGTNILEELSAALNRLEASILKEKAVVGDMQKRNTILTLVAWLKRILQTSTDDTAATSTETQLTDLLPTELLLTKLMPQLCNNDNSNNNKSTTIDNNETGDGRSFASSKRFSRQRNNRFNTIGVSKEELADARLYLQKKLLSENLASTATKASFDIDKQQNILEEPADDRRKSLNLLQSTKLDESIADLLSNTKGDSHAGLAVAVQESKIAAGKIGSSKVNREPPIQSRSKVITRRKSNANAHLSHAQMKDLDENPTTDTDEDQTSDTKGKYSNGSVGTSSKSMNKFALRKLKMKRANTIDIPKNSIEDIGSDPDKLNTNINRTETNVHDVRRLSQNDYYDKETDKNHLPEFKIKSSHDKKFEEFLNRKNEETHPSWINPNRGFNLNGKEYSKSNWISKFGSIKSSFEHGDANVSPRLSKKNEFTHAATSPFKPVQNNKPPQIPNGSYSYHNNNQQVMRKVTAINNEHKEQFMCLKPQLRAHQSLPNYANMQNRWNSEINTSNLRSNDWQPNKLPSVDNHSSLNSCSPRIMSSSYNPLYVPLNKNVQSDTQLGPSPATLPASPSISEFPSYTYTCTDYTQPTCVSTFGPEKAPIQIKNTILPDTSYLKKKQSSPPSSGSAAYNMQMKSFDMHSSSEYFSEPTNYSNYFRSPQLFSPTFMNNYDSQPESSQEHTAKSHIMQYPQTQVATVINKGKGKLVDQHKSYNNLNSIETSGIHEDRKYSYGGLSSSPFSETSFSQVNQTYVPPEPVPQNTVLKQENEIISTQHYPTKYESEHSTSICLRNNTSRYGSHAALTFNQGNQMNQLIPKEMTHRNFPTENIKSKVAAPVKLNSYGGQYMQPKVESNFDKSFPKFGKGSSVSNNVNKDVVTISGRNQTNTHHRPSNSEIKRKQSLPAQGSDYFDMLCSHNQPDLPPTHSYLPSGVLKRSKSTHTLALLQQFENKGKSLHIHKNPFTAHATKSSFDPLSTDVQEHSSANRNKIKFENKTKSVSSQQEKDLSKLEFERTSTLSNTKTDLADLNRKSNFSGQIPKMEPNIHVNNNAELRKPFLTTPAINEIPSPSVEDGHIIYPGQTNQTKNRVQHYAQTLNAMLNRRSIILGDDDTDSDRNDATSIQNGVLQKSKSGGSLLSVPKQYESAIKKSEVEEKQRTVAAYFLANKSSSQNLQRSSSQHSVLSSSSSSLKPARNNSNVASPHHLDEQAKSAESTQTATSRSMSTATATPTTTTTNTRSAHHLKILRKQQKSISNYSPLAKSQTLPSINLLDENNVDDAFEDLFASFNLNANKV